MPGTFGGGGSMRAKDELGRYGEEYAAEFLTAAGWQILDRNWRCQAGELDIVACDGTTLVVVANALRLLRPGDVA